MKKKFLLSHQAQFMRAPYLFPETRFFVFTAGYGAGKTSSVATSVLYDLNMLKDKKDREGRRPRLGLGGKSLGHLVKTTLSYILSDLENSKTPFKYNSKDSVLSVGNADLYMVSLSRPADIVGYDVCGFYGDEVDDLGSVSISSASDMTFEAVKAVNERTRQVVPGFRDPFVKFASTSQGQKGLYRVVTQFNKENTAYVRIKARTKDNTSLKKDYVDSLYKFYTETECIDAEQKIFFIRNNKLFFRPIIEVEKGDLIFNSAGWQEVEAKVVKGVKPTIKTGKVIATSDHKIYNGSDWEANGQLRAVEFYREGDIVWNWILEKYKTHVRTVKQRYLSLTDLNGTCTPVKDTICERPRKAMFGFIVMCLKSFQTPKFLGAMSFIIKTEIRLIINCIIWNVFQLKNIKLSMPKTVNVCLNLKEEERERPKLIKVLKDYALAVVKSIQQKTETLSTVNSAKIQREEKVLSAKNTIVRDIEHLKAVVRSAATRFRTRLLIKFIVLWPVETQLNELLKVRSTIRPVKTVKGNLKLIQFFVNFVRHHVSHNFTTKDRLVVDLTIKGQPEFIVGGLRCHNCKVYLEGEFLSVGSGRIFPDFDWEQNFNRIPMDKMIHPDEELYWSQDFNQGYFRGCIAVLRGNAIYVIKRYEFEQIKDAPQVVRHDFPRNKILWIPDASAKSEIMTFSAELRKYQIFWAFRGKNPNVEDTVFLCCHEDDLILTKIKGRVKNVKIKDITTEHEVWTRKGWKRVLKKIDKGRAKTITLNNLKLTPEHEVFDGKEWVHAKDAKSVFKFNEGEIKLWHLNRIAERHLQKLLSMMNGDGVDTRAVKEPQSTISDMMGNFCILMFGKNTMVKYRKAMLYTMWTVIQLTMRFQIWSVLQGVNTQAYITKKNLQKKLKQYVNAVVKYFFQRDKIIQNTVANTSTRTTEKVIQENKMKAQGILPEDQSVSSVEKSLSMLLHKNVSSALTDVLQVMHQTNLKPEGMIVPANFAENNSRLRCRIKNIAQTVVRTLRKDDGKKRVYDLMIEDEHEFVAQGILVHNCNKLLYMRRLVFTEMAKETAEACSLALRDPKTGLLPKGIGRRSPIHDIDSLRMLCYFLIFKPVMKDIRDLTIKRRLEEWKDEEEVFGDAAEAKNIIKTGGFSIIGPDLL